MGWECEIGHDTDGDGEDDDTQMDQYPHEDCEYSNDDMLWYCLRVTPPHLEGGNHSMELTVEGLDIGMNYSIDIDVWMYGMLGMDMDGDGMTIEIIDSHLTHTRQA